MMLLDGLWGIERVSNLWSLTVASEWTVNVDRPIAQPKDDSVSD